MTFRQRALPRSPTPEEYEVVKQVYEKTGILAIKDKTTGKWVKPQERCGGVPWTAPWQDTIEYGAIRQPGDAALPGSEGHVQARSMTTSLTWLVRSVYVVFVGSDKLPKGIAIGGYEVWTQDNFFENTSDHSLVDFRWDVSEGEFDQLRCYANDTTYVTNELWKQREKENAERRDGRADAQVDPVGHVGKVLAPALAEALKEALASIATRGPTPEMLAASGWTQDPKTGAWMPPKAVGAVKA